MLIVLIYLIQTTNTLFQKLADSWPSASIFFLDYKNIFLSHLVLAILETKYHLYCLSEIFNFFCRAATENSQELLMPQRLSVAIKFPFCPSNIQLEELDIPEFYNGLNSFLKKM